MAVTHGSPVWAKGGAFFLGRMSYQQRKTFSPPPPPPNVLLYSVKAPPLQNSDAKVRVTEGKSLKRMQRVMSWKGRGSFPLQEEKEPPASLMLVPGRAVMVVSLPLNG